jgi:myo-inositol-1(or 4)-monophosphatase
MNDEGRWELLETVASAGGERALASFRTPLDVDVKDGPLDAVTAVDRAVQRAIETRVDERYPDDAFVGEEDDALAAVPDEGTVWVVDPIDGTNNYVRGNRRWVTSVALVEDGVPTAAVNVCPSLGDRYAAGPGGPATRNGEVVSPSDRPAGEATAAPLLPAGHPDLGPLLAAASERLGDVRRIGCAQASLSMVAAGELDAVLSTFAVDPWDAVAGVHLVARAGGRVTDLDGDEWRPGATGLVATNGRAHEGVLETVRSVVE